ncbi:Abortive infection protein [Gemmatirosa kalamazoonensis]|uniref:Abortive infection protein n=1 Tax=Gemmatirosa kalamazoonensis TaxID=861299 RepID=W0RL88_9BACT|nr:CPBP family intramembrane glutamic endopeptidase [Gemmatirosa kalamazoonensis]AHG91541.1 Abortive infection protein [Gemmatirosa kalamazoonensis]
MPARLAPTTSSYWRLSRAPRYSLLFALPLLAAYEGLAALLSHGDAAQVRNGAEVMLAALFSLVAGPRGGMVVVALVVLGCVGLAGWDMRRSGARLQRNVFALMLAESAVLAVVCGLVIGVATARLLHAVQPHLAITHLAIAPAPDSAMASLGWPTKLMLALGAGLFEELLFRVLLVGALAFGLRRVLGAGPTLAGAVASGVGALVFAAAHYIGAYGDAFTLASFTFRALAGLFFSVLYVLRGFGITAWSHALYDVMVLTVG